MLAQNKKKIYIINFNPNDFFDLTLDSIEAIKKSDIVISSTLLKKKFQSCLKKLNDSLEIKSEIKKNDKDFTKYLKKKLDQYNSLSLMQTGGFNFYNYFAHKNLFDEKKTSIEIKIGILPIVNLLNKDNKLINNRLKNSSVTFLNYLNINKSISIIKTIGFEKLIVRTFDKIKVGKFIENLKLIKNLNVNHYIYNNDRRLDIIDESTEQKEYYIVVEKNE